MNGSVSTRDFVYYSIGPEIILHVLHAIPALQFCLQRYLKKKLRKGTPITWCYQNAGDPPSHIYSKASFPESLNLLHDDSILYTK